MSMLRSSSIGLTVLVGIGGLLYDLTGDFIDSTSASDSETTFSGCFGGSETDFEAFSSRSFFYYSFHNLTLSYRVIGPLLLFSFIFASLAAFRAACFFFRASSRSAIRSKTSIFSTFSLGGDGDGCRAFFYI
jgi:hypothetical protein